MAELSLNSSGHAAVAELSLWTVQVMPQSAETELIHRRVAVLLQLLSFSSYCTSFFDI